MDRCHGQHLIGLIFHPWCTLSVDLQLPGESCLTFGKAVNMTLQCVVFL